MLDKKYMISVIVPVYNVEKYLKKCVDSIINQTYKNLEIILVDDGSPDNCGAICDEYAAKDSRVKVIHKSNGGLSDARNAGMKVAAGDYFAFVDSDDWIEHKMFERLLNNSIKYNAEISVGGVKDLLELDTGEHKIFKTTYDGNIKNYVLSSEEAMKKYFYGSWAAWDKIYKRNVFDGIWYPVGEINEDEAIVLQLLDRCKNVCYTNEVFYNYITRPKSNSITASAFNEKKLAWCKHCKCNYEYIKNNHPSIISAAAKRYASSLIWALNNMLLDIEKYSELIIEIKSQLKELNKESKILKEFVLKERVRAFLLLNMLKPYSKLIKLLNKHYT